MPQNPVDLVAVDSLIHDNQPYIVYRFSDGRVIVTPQNISGIVHQRTSEPLVPDKSSPYQPRTLPYQETRTGMDSLTRYLLLGMGGFLVLCFGALMLRPPPPTVIPPIVPTPPPRYPVYERQCRPAGMFGWGQECYEQRRYEY